MKSDDSIMGSTVGIMREDKAISSKNLESDLGTALRSAGGLQLLLEQTELRENLQDFISTKWIPCMSDEEFQKYVQISPRTLALNCIDFWADVQDFLKIEPSLFQLFRAFHLYEKYIVHGASHLVSKSSKQKMSCMVN